MKKLLIITLTLIFLSTQGIIFYTEVIRDILVVFFLLFSFFNEKFVIKIYKGMNLYMVLKLFIIPLCIIFIYSMIMHSLKNLSVDFYQHTIMLCVRYLLYMLLFVRAYQMFKMKTVEFVLYAALFAYIPAMIKHFATFGIINGINILFLSDVDSMNIALEVHSLTYLFGFVFIYFLYNKIFYGDKNNRNLILSMILCILGLKRIVFVSILIVLLILLLFYNMKGKKVYRLAILISLVIIVMSYIYIIVVYNGDISKIFDKYDINSNFRVNFWNYIKYKYDVSLSFFGYGIGYSHRIMMHEWSNIPGLGASTNIHNDILGYYLGLGFIGFAIFNINFYLIKLRLINKYYTHKEVVFSCVISLYYFINMTVSNIGIDPLLNGIYFLVIYSSLNRNKFMKVK